MSDNASPASGANAADGGLNMTQAEARFFACMTKHSKTIDVNWDKFAVEMGFKNEVVAKTRYRQIRKKLGLDGSATEAGADTSADAMSPSPKAMKTVKGARVTKPRKPKAKQPKPLAVADVPDDKEAALDADEGEA
ncbi:hypothetical protein F4802DRAFT_599356 [Xylaria palmicola]|nr:hypothetical protein F4802DRAFT_599356 [Xylaria palmicola]